MSDDNTRDVLRYAVSLAFDAGRDFGREEMERRFRRAIASVMDGALADASNVAFERFEQIADHTATKVKRDARALDVWTMIREARDASKGDGQ